MTKQFAGSIGQVSNQINKVIMGLAGAHRIFSLLDEEPETDDGYVTLVNAKENAGRYPDRVPRAHHGMGLETSPSRRHRYLHPADRRMCGSTMLTSVIRRRKPFFDNVSLYAKPGQKIAFVGATGAGKTTITNLINRFYDIADGKIRYDGININKIKKADLRPFPGV